MDIDYVSRLIDGLEDESVDVIKKLVSHYEATKELHKSLANAYEHIQHEAYNDALSSILEAQSLLPPQTGESE